MKNINNHAHRAVQNEKASGIISWRFINIHHTGSRVRVISHTTGAQLDYFSRADDFASLSDSLIILDIYPVEMSFVPFIISVRALPTPKRYCIHSIYRAPPSAKGNFKVATKISGGINLQISSYVRLTAPYRLSRNESLIGFHRCLFSIPLPPNTASSGLIIGTYFQSK